MLIDHQGRRYFLHEPNTCPFCHHKNQPRLLSHHIGWNEEIEHFVLAFFECGFDQCKQIIGVEFHLTGTNFFLHRFLNGNPEIPAWPAPIVNLKNNSNKAENQESKTKFVEIYMQSLKAENLGLNEIAGMGYRKAIEYLVKDVAISDNPDEADEIKKMLLGPVIRQYFKDDLKEMLDRAAWLGNDETHYNRLFEEFDMQDLKEIIQLIVTDLDNKYKKKLYREAIQGRK